MEMGMEKTDAEIMKDATKLIFGKDIDNDVAEKLAEIRKQHEQRSRRS